MGFEITPLGIWWVVIPPTPTPAVLGWQSGSLAIISKRVGLERGGGDIGLRSPAVRAELNLLKDDGNVSRVAAPPPWRTVVVVVKESIKWGSVVGE